jgi:CheY-like chemotaxis protein
MNATPTDAAVLVIGDNGLERDFVVKGFQNAGFSNPVHVLKDMEEGKKYLQGEGPYADRKRFPVPRLALLDYKDPEPAGWEMLRWMRNQAMLTNLPVVVFGESANPEHEKKAIDSGAAYHIKPRKPEEYGKLMRRMAEFWLLNFGG